MTVMDKYFICLANSYKHGGRCLAGIEIVFNDDGKQYIVRHDDGRPIWIRPVSNELDGSIPTAIAERIKLFSVVRMTDAVPCPEKAHVEDTKYSTLECQQGYFMPNDELLKLCVDSKHQNVFYFRGKAIPAKMVDRLDYSLMLIKPEEAQAYIDENREKSKYRMRFTYYGSHYDFPITDPVFLEVFKKNPEHYSNLQNVYLTLSLGLEFEGFHFKLVAAVIMPQSEKQSSTTGNWFESYDLQLARLIDLKKDVENQIASLRMEIIEQMEKHWEEKVSSTRFTVSYQPPRTILQFDGKLFREENQELYKSYCKPKEKEASIVVRQNNIKE